MMERGAPDPTTASSVEVQRGRLRIVVTAAQWLAWSQMANPAVDFLLEVDTTLDDNTTPGEVGDHVPQTG